MSLPENADLFSSIARLALEGIEKEFPYQPAHAHLGPAEWERPRDIHPVFYGCYDWHSAVHAHWSLVRIARLFPGLPVASNIPAVLEKRLNGPDLQVEADYFDHPAHRGFERMYGWAWFLRLAAELDEWKQEKGPDLLGPLLPLETTLRDLTKAYLGRLSFPIRSGVHSDTAFALTEILKSSRIRGDQELVGIIVDRAIEFYGEDCEYPFSWEPSGEDFFSAGLNVANLMATVLPNGEFEKWFEGFVPSSEALKKLEPVIPPSLTDGRLAHLAGLNLARSWAARGIGQAFPSENPLQLMLLEMAESHLKEGLQYIDNGDYAGDHWLGTFALYALTEDRD